jgi:hypothetical protein
MPYQDSFRIAENLLLRSLEKENEMTKSSEDSYNHITKKELLTIIHALTIRKVQNKDLWRNLLVNLMRHFNEGGITLRELTNLAYDLKIINLKSPKVYEIIVDYFGKHGFTDQDLISLGQRNTVNFLHSIYFCHPTL